MRQLPLRIRPLPKMPIEEVARDGGYRSENKFYTRVRQYTGLAPSEIRALPDEAFERLLLEKLPMRSRDRMSRISSLFTN